MKISKTTHFTASGYTSVHSMLTIGQMTEGYTDILKCGAENIMVSMLENAKYTRLDFHARYLFFVLCSVTLPTDKMTQFSCPIGHVFCLKGETYLLEEI